MHCDLRRSAIGLAGLVLLATGVTACSSEGADAAPAVSLELGDCVFFIETEGTGDSSMNQVPCEELHHGEAVLASEDFFSDDPEMPDEARVQGLADTACAEAMEAYTGKRPEDTSFRMSYLYPTAETWEAGDRKLTCIAVAFHPETGSPVAGTGSIRAGG